jgi:hypothetical protein
LLREETRDVEPVRVAPADGGEGPPAARDGRGRALIAGMRASIAEADRFLQTLLE